tara:strand:- start:230 stop:424 length:195 start_codon:yes stop_codon:yes gene_type:complete
MEIDPIINSSNLSIEVKYYLNKILVEDFNNDWNLLLEDMMQHAVGEEQYEIASIIKKYLNPNKE